MCTIAMGCAILTSVELSFLRLQLLQLRDVHLLFFLQGMRVLALPRNTEHLSMNNHIRS